MKRERILKPREKTSYVEPLEERMQKVDLVLKKIRHAAEKNEVNRISEALMKQQEESAVTFKMVPVFDKLSGLRITDLIEEMTAQVLEKMEEDRKDWTMI